MSKTAITSQSVTISGDGLVYNDGPHVVQNNNALAPSTQALVNGPTTINVPVGAMGVKIEPPSTNAFTLTLKGVSGDTGMALSKVSPSTWLFDTSPPASFVLTASGSFTVGLIWL